MAEKTREQFLRDRKSGIGGSDVAAIMGLSKFRTAFDVWKDKTSDEITENKSDILELASYLEEYTAQKYAKLTGHKVRKKNIELVHKEFPFLKGNIDREILLDSDRGLGILECKALSTFSFKRVKMYGLPDDYVIQIQHYFLVGNGKYSWGAFAILNRDNGELLTFEVEPDLSLQKSIIDICVPFWNESVLKRIQPVEQIDTVDTESVKISKFDGAISDLSGDETFNSLLEQRRENDELYKEAKLLRDDIDEQIKAHLGDIEAAEGKTYRVFYKSSSRTAIDSTRLKKEKPELYKEYSKTTVSERSLKFYTLNKEA